MLGVRGGVLRCVGVLPPSAPPFSGRTCAHNIDLSSLRTLSLTLRSAAVSSCDADYSMTRRHEPCKDV